ncbi:MAG: TetR/AcrR family transcriptional regulator [Myxococcota bacterium]
MQTDAPRGPGRPRSAEAHEAILDAAMQTVRAVGYDSATIEAVAARAGVGKATVYRRWPSKELLLVEAVGRFVAGLPTPDTGAVESDLAALLASTVAVFRDPDTRPLMTGLVAVMARSDAIAEAVRGGLHASRHGAFLAVLRRGVWRGELAPETDLDLAVELLVGPLFYRLAWTGEPTGEAHAVTVASAVLRGLRPR